MVPNTAIEVSVPDLAKAAAVVLVVLIMYGSDSPPISTLTPPTSGSQIVGTITMIITRDMATVGVTPMIIKKKKKCAQTTLVTR